MTLNRMWEWWKVSRHVAGKSEGRQGQALYYTPYVQSDRHGRQGRRTIGQGQGVIDYRDHIHTVTVPDGNYEEGTTGIPRKGSSLAGRAQDAQEMYCHSHIKEAGGSADSIIISLVFCDSVAPAKDRQGRRPPAHRRVCGAAIGSAADSDRQAPVVLVGRSKRRPLHRAGLPRVLASPSSASSLRPQGNPHCLCLSRVHCRFVAALSRHPLCSRRAKMLKGILYIVPVYFWSWLTSPGEECRIPPAFVLPLHK